jgi:hypothetical protein
VPIVRHKPYFRGLPTNHTTATAKAMIEAKTMKPTNSSLIDENNAAGVVIVQSLHSIRIRL